MMIRAIYIGLLFEYSRLYLSGLFRPALAKKNESQLRHATQRAWMLWPQKCLAIFYHLAVDCFSLQ